MTPSTFVARILGPVLVTVGIGLLLEGDTFRTMADEFLHSAALIYLSGVITLTLGLAILNVHPLWVRDWRVPRHHLRLAVSDRWHLQGVGAIFDANGGRTLIAHQRWPLAGAIVTLALGAFLTVMGYQDAWGGGQRRPSHRSSAAGGSGSASRSTKRPRRKASEARWSH